MDHSINGSDPLFNGSGKYRAVFDQAVFVFFFFSQVVDQIARPLAIAQALVKIEQSSSKEMLPQVMRIALSSICWWSNCVPFVFA